MVKGSADASLLHEIKVCESYSSSSQSRALLLVPAQRIAYNAHVMSGATCLLSCPTFGVPARGHNDYHPWKAM